MRNLVNLSVLLFVCFTFSVVMAESLDIPAEGEYVMGEGETMEVAGEKARKNAIRAAAEQAGSFVRSYSKVNNLVLQEDVIEVTASHSMKVTVLDEQTELLGKKSLRFRTRIKATISSEAVAENLRKAREDLSVVDAYQKLKQDYEKLAQETKQLKTRLQEASGEERSKVVARIVSEEVRFKANLLYEKGEKLFREEFRLIEAEQLFSEAIRLNPGFALAFAARAQVRIQSTSGAESAMADIDQALALDPRNGRFYMIKAAILRSGTGENQCSRDFRASCSKVFAALDAAIALEPANSWYRITKAGVLAAIQDHEGAIREADKAISISGAVANAPVEVIAALLSKSEFLSLKGELPQALEVLDKVVRLVESPDFFTPDDRQTLETVVSTWKQGESEEKYRERLLKKFGVPVGDEAGAKRVLEQVEKSMTRVMLILHVFDERAKFRLMTHDYAGGKSDALKSCEWVKPGITLVEDYPFCADRKALERKFSPAGYWFAKGQQAVQEYDNGQEERKGKPKTYDEALVAYGKAISLDSTFVEAYLARADLHNKLAFSEVNWRHAVLDCTEALRLDPKLSYAWMTRGRLFEELGEVDEAMHDFKKVIDLGQSGYTATARSNRIRILREKGNQKAALEEARQFARAESDYGLAHKILAEISEQMGLLGESLQAWKDYLRYLEDLYRNHQGGEQEIGQIREKIGYLQNETEGTSR